MEVDLCSFFEKVWRFGSEGHFSNLITFHFFYLAANKVEDFVGKNQTEARINSQF